MVPGPAPAPAPVVLTTQQAQQMLSTAYATFKTNKTRTSNAPHNCPNINRATYNMMRNQWSTAPAPGGRKMGPNSQRQVAGDVLPNKDRIKKWVGGSVSGAGGTVDFHAWYISSRDATFLYHFRVV